MELILKVNYIYLNCCKIILLYDDLVMLLKNKLDDFDNKISKIYNENFYKLKYNKIFLKEEILNIYYNYIVSKYNFEENFKSKLKEKIKEEILQEIDINQIQFPKSLIEEKKNDVDYIIQLMKYYLKDEIFI